MITKAKKFFQWGLLLAILGLGFYSIFLRDIGTVDATTSRANLQSYQHNLDVLEDKTGNLDTLIGELQNYRIFTVTGCVKGTTIPVAGLLPTDEIRSIMVYTSASVVSGSTIIGRAGDGQLVLQSKIWGLPSVSIQATFTRKGTTDVSSATLSINTTGYAFEVKLASVDSNKTHSDTEFSSAVAICAAINGHSWLSQLLVCSTGYNLANSFSTNSFQSAGYQTGPLAGVTEQRLIGSLPSPWTSNIGGYVAYAATAAANSGTFRLPGSYATITSSGNVVISTAAPIGTSDGVELSVYGYRP